MNTGITIDWQPIAGTILIFFGAGLGIWQGWRWFDTRKPDAAEPKRNSDAPAPDGFSAHVQLICETAPAATPAIREAYLIDGLSESEVLRAECKRLADEVSK
jgi:hypothetical protein